MKSFLSIAFLLALLRTASAQLISDSYDWDAQPKPHTLSASELSNKIVGIKDKRILEYTYDDAKKTDLVMYYTKHVIVKVNSPEGIEEFNKIYLPVSGTLDVVKIKARS